MTAWPHSADNPDSPGSAPSTWWPHVTAFSLVVVELCWVLPWYHTLVWQGQALSMSPAALLLGGIMLVSYGAAYSMEALLLLRNVQLGALALLLLLDLALAQGVLLGYSPGEALGSLLKLNPGVSSLVIFVFWMWWRGISLARQAIHPHNAWRRFELGLGLFMIHIFVAYRLVGAAPSLCWSMFFLFAGFLSILFARISHVGLGRGVSGNPFNRRWLAGVSAIIAVSVAVATALGFLLAGRGSLLLDGLAKGIRLLFQVILFVAAIPAVIVAFIIAPLMELLRQALPAPTPNLTPTVVTPDPYFLIPEWPGVTAPRPLPPIVQALIFWGLLLILVVFLLLRLRPTRRGAPPAALGQPESLLGPGEARELMRKALQGAVDNLAARLRPARQGLAAEHVRRIYAALMELCADKGSPRPPEYTPLEFLPAMQGLFEAADQDLDLITQAYIQLRYGEYPETEAQVQAVQAAWERIAERARGRMPTRAEEVGPRALDS